MTRERKEAEDNSFLLRAICYFNKVVKMNPSSLSLIVTHFPGSKSREVEGGNRRRVIDI